MTPPFFVAASTVFSAYMQSDYFGKLIFWCLFILSVFSWVLLINKVKINHRLKRFNEQLEQLFEKNKENILGINFHSHLFSSHPYLQLFRLLRQQTLEVLKKNSYFIHGTQDKEVYLSQADIEMIGSYLHTKIVQITRRFEKNLFILSTIVTLAPFLGLLGTVWGILVTFSHLQTHALSSGNTAVLAGLSMALATTVVGLVVAIPALVGYNYLKNAARNLQQDMESFSGKLLVKVEMQYRNVEKVMK